MPDLKTNLRFDTGVVKCHSTQDLELTPYGDIALTSSDLDLFDQQFLLYWGTPPGERIDPNIGCPWYDFQHERATDTELARFEAAMEKSIEYHFPELKVQSVKFEYLDTRTIFGDITLSSGSIKFLLDRDEMMDLENNIWAPYRDLLSTGDDQ